MITDDIFTCGCQSSRIGVKNVGSGVYSVLYLQGMIGVPYPGDPCDPSQPGDYSFFNGLWFGKIADD